MLLRPTAPPLRPRRGELRSAPTGLSNGVMRQVPSLMQSRYAIASSALFICLACGLAPMAHAQASHCLSDVNVCTELIASVRSALRSPGVPAAVAAKADSVTWISSDSVCAVAVNAFNPNAVDGVSAVCRYVAPPKASSTDDPLNAQLSTSFSPSSPVPHPSPRARRAPAPAW